MRFFFIPALVVLAFITISVVSKAQEICGTDHYHRFMMQTDPEYRSRFTQIQEQLRINHQSRPGQQRPGDQLYTIPIVVHVIHLGEPIGTGTNITDAVIQQAIQGLNDRFRNVIGTSIDLEVQFCLATRDPNGCPTTGINRVNGMGVTGYPANGMSITVSCGGNPPNHTALKDLSRWPVSEYYNVWVVNKICGGFGGWTFYPNGNNYDGAAMSYNYMNSINPLLSHEVGHGFNLFHTFEGDGGNLVCPPNSVCIFEGDGVCDTPPHRQGDCGGNDPCSAMGIWENSRSNFMSYCNNVNLFTPGQKVRARATFAGFPRGALLNSIGCTAPTGSVPLQPDPITGPTTVSPGDMSTYAVNSVPSATGYAWQIVNSMGGNITSGQNTNSINVSWTTSGSYTLNVNPNNACGTGAARSLSIVVSPVTAINDVDDPFQLRVFPNPTHGEFIITGKGFAGKKVSIAVTNIWGQSVISWSELAITNNYRKTFDLKGLSQGFYFATIMIEGKVYELKIARIN